MNLMNNILAAELKRFKRDLVCASGGNRFCNVYCKGKGHKDGACTWDLEDGSFNCMCDQEMRGIR